MQSTSKIFPFCGTNISHKFICSRGTLLYLLRISCLHSSSLEYWVGLPYFRCSSHKACSCRTWDGTLMTGLILHTVSCHYCKCQRLSLVSSVKLKMCSVDLALYDCYSQFCPHILYEWLKELESVLYWVGLLNTNQLWLLWMVWLWVVFFKCILLFVSQSLKFAKVFPARLRVPN